MSRTALKTAGLAGLLVMASSAANAAIVLDVKTPTGPTPSGTNIEYQFETSNGAGTLDIVIDAFGTVDGANTAVQDFFMIMLNGEDIFRGSFRLGGLGDNAFLFGNDNAVITAVDGGRGNGGTLSLVTPISFDSFTGDGSDDDGLNTLSVGFAGTGSDELFSVRAVQITGPGPVPEPGTWLMMILGFAGVGFALRRGKSEQRLRVNYS